MMTAVKPIRVFVIDDSESIRLSLHQFLSVFADLQWVGESSDGQDSLEQCEWLRPDVVLIDVVLPHIDVAHTTCQIRERFPLTQVIGITSFEEQAFIDEILKAGAVLCLPKNATIARFADAVRQAAEVARLPNLSGRPGCSPAL